MTYMKHIICHLSYASYGREYPLLFHRDLAYILLDFCWFKKYIYFCDTNAAYRADPFLILIWLSRRYDSTMVQHNQNANGPIRVYYLTPPRQPN